MKVGDKITQHFKCIGLTSDEDFEVVFINKENNTIGIDDGNDVPRLFNFKTGKIGRAHV